MPNFFVQTIQYLFSANDIISFLKTFFIYHKILLIITIDATLMLINKDDAT